MPAVHRLLATVNNAVAAATLTASSVLPASNSVFRQPTVRSGNGLVQLSGGYTGSATGTIDVEIRPPATGAERVSSPTFAGAGTGILTAATVTGGTAAQAVTVTLVDAGTNTTPARLALYANLALVAKTAGVAGNSLTLTITPSLTLGAVLGATAVALNQDTHEWSDQRLDFGAAALNADGSVPDNAPRLVFNGDLSRVYRHYKRWDGTRWQYGTSPALGQSVLQGSSVYPVTGSYSVVISNGTTSETYPALTTLYSLLRALAASALVTVEGVVANDLQPGGQAAIDLPLRTSAWVASVIPSSGLSALPVTCDPTALTDQIDVTCAGGGFNAEQWIITSKAHGQLGRITTGAGWDTLLHFRIPVQDASTVSAPVTLKTTAWASRAVGELTPVLVLKAGTLGVAATAKTLTLKYTARPDLACASLDYAPSGVISPDLLGLSMEEVQTLDSNYQTRLQSLYSYRQTFVARNSAIRAVPATIVPMFYALGTKSGQPDLSTSFATPDQLETWQTAQMADGWTVSYWQLGAAEFSYCDTVWTASTVFTSSTKIMRLLPDKTPACFSCTTAGTSAATQPLWGNKGSICRNGRIDDGTVQWERTSTQTATSWAATTAYAVGAVITHIDVYGKLAYYIARAGGTSATTNDMFFMSTAKLTVSDGTAVWTKFAQTAEIVWKAFYFIDSGQVINSGRGYYYTIATGITGPNPPNWGSADTLVDGAVVWTRAVTYEAISASITTQDLAFIDGILSILGGCLSRIYTLSAARTAWDAVWTAAQADLTLIYNVGGSVEQVVYDAGFLERYRAQCDMILINQGISPGKFEAGSRGSAVWPDTGDAFWWEFQDADYLPLFTNQIYHSCQLNAAGQPASTQEFAFALVCACAQRLKVGDTAVVHVGSSAAGYALGANWSVAVIGSAPLRWAGGRAGSDTLTWAVQSSTQGALADYALTLAQLPYSAGGLGFQIQRGALAFALGDRFAFSVETGGRYRWRKNAGSWSSDTALPTAAVLLTDGLSATFIAGPAPAFVYGDLHSFQIRQPASPGQVLHGDSGRWQWTGASPTLTVTWAANQTISAVGLLRHALTSGATVSIALKNSGGTTLQTVTFTVTPGPLVAFLATALTTVRSLVVTLGNADSMSIGWLYAGTPFVPSHNATTCLVRRAYALERGGGINPSNIYLGAGRGGELSWADWLTQSDVDALLTLVDACKSAGDEPLVVVPNVAYPGEAALCRIYADELELSDEFEFQPNAASRRRLSLKLPLTAVVG